VITNLCFHGVGTLAREREPGETKYWVSESLFHAILDEVTRHSHVRLSFDDGNKSDILTGLPALQERRLRATFFPLVGRLDDPDSLDGSDLRVLRSAGMDIGSHGWEHIPWRRLTQEQARRELIDARDVLARVSAGPVHKAALPLGRYDRVALRLLRGAGYTTVYTSDRAPARERSWLQARYSVTANDSVESVRAIMTSRLGFTEARNLAASVVKSLR
jgi:peptidoglycan/xylan/chitin deacetylase (PgdA/CDA1 family)